jgi:hypothetical protein
MWAAITHTVGPAVGSQHYLSIMRHVTAVLRAAAASNRRGGGSGAAASDASSDSSGDDEAPAPGAAAATTAGAATGRLGRPRRRPPMQGSDLDAAILRDWIRDSGGASALTYGAFALTWFLVADQWTNGAAAVAARARRGWHCVGGRCGGRGGGRGGGGSDQDLVVVVTPPLPRRSHLRARVRRIHGRALRRPRVP